MPLEGNLRDFNLANLIQLSCNEMVSGKLALTNNEQEGEIYFDGGTIIHAALGSLVGEEAVYELLRWAEGSFRVEKGATTKQKTVETHWSGLLLEGMHRIDEGEASMANELKDWIEALRGISGVEGVVFVSADGVVVAESLDGDVEKEGAVAVFLGGAADQLGGALSLPPFDWAMANMGDYRMLTIKKQDFYVGILLGEKASPAMVSGEAEKILGA